MTSRPPEEPTSYHVTLCPVVCGCALGVPMCHSIRAAQPTENCFRPLKIEIPRPAAVSQNDVATKKKKKVHTVVRSILDPRHALTAGTIRTNITRLATRADPAIDMNVKEAKGSEEGQRASARTTPTPRTGAGDADSPMFSSYMEDEEDMGSKRVTARASVDIEGGDKGGHGDDNIMLGFQGLSISSDDPPKHIVANVSGFVVKGTTAVQQKRERYRLHSIDSLMLLVDYYYCCCCSWYTYMNVFG